MASILQSRTGAPALIAGRAAELCPSTHVLRSGSVARHQRRRTQAFGSARPKRVLVQAQVQAVSDAIAAPVAEVVKRLQGKVYLAGISGQLGSRIVKELLQAGVSVVAGVPEGDPADDALDFALQFELIKKSEGKALTIQQVDFADADSFKIPRGSTVLIVQGDQQGRRKMDAKLVGQAIDAAIEANAARIVLASPLGGAGGFFGGFFGGGVSSAGPGDLKLRRPEQQVFNSGLPFSIVRYGAPTDSLTPAGNVAVTPAGETSKSAPLGRAQAAKVVAEVLQQTPPGTNVVLEAGVSVAAVAAPLAFAVAAALPQAEIAAPEEEEEPEPAPAPARPSPARRAVQQASQAVEDATEDAEEAAESAAPAFDLKSLFGGARPKAAAEDVEEELEEVAQAAAKPFASLFGGKPRQAAGQAEDAAEGVAMRVKTLWGRKPKQAQQEVRQGTRRVGREAKQKGREAASAASRAAKQVKRQAQEAAPRTQSGSVFRSLLGLDEDKEEEAEAPKPRFGFGSGTRKVSSLPAAKPDKRAARAARTAPKQVARGAKSAANGAQSAAKKAEKKSGGFLQSLGISQETVYADEN